MRVCDGGLGGQAVAKGRLQCVSLGVGVVCGGCNAWAIDKACATRAVFEALAFQARAFAKAWAFPKAWAFAKACAKALALDSERTAWA